MNTEIIFRLTDNAKINAMLNAIAGNVENQACESFTLTKHTISNPIIK